MDAVPERWADRFDERMLKQIAFCKEYEARFNHGAPGHLDMLVISRLADCLVSAESGFAGLQSMIAELSMVIDGPNPKATNILRESLAAYAHDAWSGWMEYLFSKCERDGDPEAGHERDLIIPAWAVERWKRQATTAYHALPEEEKASDRTEADKMIAMMQEVARAQR
jgi:hypothetical protein